MDFWALIARNVSSGLSLEDAKNGASLAKMLLGASPSKNWAEGGAIIEREKISIQIDSLGWVADTGNMRYYRGTTPLIAAMRGYVASVYGENVSE